MKCRLVTRNLGPALTSAPSAGGEGQASESVELALSDEQLEALVELQLEAAGEDPPVYSDSDSNDLNRLP